MVARAVRAPGARRPSARAGRRRAAPLEGARPRWRGAASAQLSLAATALGAALASLPAQLLALLL
eukprot:2372706-Pyramimonas_sp.AAC.1